MKKRFLSLALLLFTSCAVSTMTVKAAEPTQQTTVQKTASTTQVTATQTVKVNKNVKAYKLLKIKKKKMKNYTITSSNPRVATVSAAGVIRGVKKGSSVVTLVSNANQKTYATINIKVKNNYTKKQLRLMSAIIYSEAGAECFAGKKAVGIVIMNRVKSKSYPNSLNGVIYQPYQFGPVRNGSLKRSLALYDNKSLNKSCITAAKRTLNGDKNVRYKKQTIDMSSYLFFSGYVSGARLSIQSHQFK